MSEQQKQPVAAGPNFQLVNATIDDLGGDWPGNVRELAHALERSVALARDSVLDVEDLPAVIRGARSQPVADLAADLPTLEQLKHRYIQHVVELHGGNVSRAAAVLGIERRSLYRMLRRYGIAHRVTEE